MLTALRWALLGIVVVFLALLAAPYGRDHTNPPVRAEPSWDSPQTRELEAHAGYDCHSNETKSPWYSNITPISWLIEYDVKRGRDEVNFSDGTSRRRTPMNQPRPCVRDLCRRRNTSCSIPKRAFPLMSGKP